MVLVGYWMLLIIFCGSQHASANNVSALVEVYTNLRLQAGCDVDLCSDTRTDATPHTFPPATCCSGCSCTASCARNGDCCPDMLQTFPHADQYPTGGVYGCIYRRHKFTNMRFDGVMVVSKCDMEYLDLVIDRRCTFSGYETWNKNIESYVPVVDAQTNETFRNYFCAKCNFVPDDRIVQWDVAIECIDGAVFMPMDTDSLIDDIATVNDCDIVYKPPVGYPTPEQCNTRLISSCNETGNWRTYDQFLVEACSAFRAIFYYTYANIFCYMCNTEDISVGDIECLGSGLGTGDSWIPSFSLLLDFRSSPKSIDSDSQCSGGFEYDYYKGQCREVVCADRMVYDNGTCRSLFVNTPIGTCYEMFIKISPIDRHISPTSADFKTALMAFTLEIMDRDDVFSVYDIHAPVMPADSDQTETIYDTYYILHVEFVGKNAIALAMDIIELDNTRANVSVTAWYETVDVLLQITSYEVFRNFQNGQSTEHVLWQSWGNDTDRLFTITSDVLPIFCPTSRLLLTKVSSCPMVALNLSEFVFDERHTGIYLVALDLLFRPGTFTYDVHTSILEVCVSDYIEWTKAKYGVAKTSNTNNAVSEVMTLVCSTISIVCLVIVVVTYLLYPGLRSQPGMNNMAMSLCLLLAQTLFIFGVERSELGIMCSVIGGFIHFLFLSVIFWMGICSVHMFRVFRNMTFHKESGSAVKTTSIYTAAVFVLSAVCVVVNMAVSNIRSSGSDYGYGGTESNCYISSAVMIGYTITLPAGLVVAVNIFMFLSVVVRINRMPVVQSSTMQNRRYFSIYVRLSTVTGTAWLSVIPYLFTNSKVFEYISIVLTSSQGVFIFVAFIFNRRVFNLYKTSLGLNVNVAHSTSRQLTTHMAQTRIQQA